MNNKDSIKNKIETIQNTLKEMDCIPKSNWIIYWKTNIPKLTNEDKKLLPPKVLESYNKWNLRINFLLVWNGLWALILLYIAAFFSYKLFMSI
jgi:hypothetical protein